jgi:hypothetical protein
MNRCECHQPTDTNQHIDGSGHEGIDRRHGDSGTACHPTFIVGIVIDSTSDPTLDLDRRLVL